MIPEFEVMSDEEREAASPLPPKETIVIVPGAAMAGSGRWKKKMQEAAWLIGLICIYSESESATNLTKVMNDMPWRTINGLRLLIRMEVE